MGAQGQLTQGPNVPNPRTKYKLSKHVFAVTSIALIVRRDWPRSVQPLAQSLTRSPGTLHYQYIFATYYSLGVLIRLNRFLKIEKIEIDLIDLNRFKSIFCDFLRFFHQNQI